MTTIEHIPWTCDVCHQPVDDGTGYIHVDHHEVGTVERAWRNYEAHERQREIDAGGPTFVDMEALMALPDRAAWRVHHHACDPDPEHSCYWIDVADLRTLVDVLDRNAHLHGKTWTEHTDWNRTIAARVRAATTPSRLTHHPERTP